MVRVVIDEGGRAPKGRAGGEAKTEEEDDDEEASFEPGMTGGENA